MEQIKFSEEQYLQELKEWTVESDDKVQEILYEDDYGTMVYIDASLYETNHIAFLKVSIIRMFISGNKLQVSVDLDIDYEMKSEVLKSSNVYKKALLNHYLENTKTIYEVGNKIGYME